MCKKLTIFLIIAVFIINLSACNKSTTNPTKTETTEVVDLNYSEFSKYIVVENKTDNSLSINKKDSSSNYIKSVKKNGYYLNYLESGTNEFIMKYEKNSLIPSEITINAESQVLNGYILNYNEENKTFDISWKKDNIEILYSKNIKLTSEIDESKLVNLDDEQVYRIKTMMNSYIVADSINEYMNNNPQPRFWWVGLILTIVFGFFTGGSGVIRF